MRTKYDGGGGPVERVLMRVETVDGGNPSRRKLQAGDDEMMSSRIHSKVRRRPSWKATLGFHFSTSVARVMSAARPKSPSLIWVWNLGVSRSPLIRSTNKICSVVTERWQI